MSGLCRSSGSCGPRTWGKTGHFECGFLTLHRFLNDLPLLHFLDERAFASPTPLLLASVLYISALRSPLAELTSNASGYFVATCSAIAELALPASVSSSRHSGSKSERHLNGKEEEAFHNILGLVLASLSSEAYIETTGSWISIAYRLLLDNCPGQVDEATHDWQGLFSGLQVR